MIENCPSRTALGVAKRRAAHQIMDDPKVFDDPFALRVLGLGNASAQDAIQKWPEKTPLSGVLRDCSRLSYFVAGLFLEEAPLSRVFRASLVARSRYAEDELHAAVKQGVNQYVVLGAGLDTFAFRNPYPGDVLHVFEVDHPATQIWKRKRLEEAGMPIPQTLTFAPVDFETQTLEDGLHQTGFDRSKSAFFSWLGVTMYLTMGAISSTLRFVASMPVGSRIVFDYIVSPSLFNPVERMFFDSLKLHVALAGEPFKAFFEPSVLKTTLHAMGFGQIEDIEPGEMHARYFQGRTDRLRVAGRLAHVIKAHV